VDVAAARVVDTVEIGPLTVSMAILMARRSTHRWAIPAKAMELD